MESVAELNNQGVMLMATAMYDDACQCFETALRGLLSRSSNNNSAASSGRCQRNYTRTTFTRSASTTGQSRPFNIACNQEDATKDGAHQEQEEQAQSPLPPAIDIIQFFDDMASSKEVHMSDDMKNTSSEEEDFSPSRHARQSDSTTSFLYLETHGITIDIASLKREEIQRCYEQHHYQSLEEPDGQEEASLLPLFTLLSAVTLFNMALSYHQAGLSKINSKKLHAASQLYQKSRYLLMSLKCPAEYGVRSRPFSSFAAVMIEIICMATWNNQGLLAHSQADYNLSQKCFEHLHSESLCFITTPQREDLTLSAAETPHWMEDSPGSRNASSEDFFHCDNQENRLLDYSREKVYRFFLNALCYRNTMMAAAA